MSKFSKTRWKSVRDSIKVYSLDTIIHFGKYRGVTLQNIIESDWEYVRYLINQCNKELDNPAYEYLERFEQ
jgi:hypothetical protein